VAVGPPLENRICPIQYIPVPEVDADEVEAAIVPEFQIELPPP
jgi:hypothetical protein